MSGGQGTRLGFDHPKGMYDLGLHCKLTLFGYFAHRLIRLSTLANCQYPHSVINKHNMIKWYIMTS
jgi:UDP-N-acetylglucosamine/UDP-N-acetylgalactosamine diphosphorylase